MEITSDTVHAVARLATHRTQERFVASVHASYGDALFPEPYGGGPLVPWLRTVEADDETVGFVMVALTSPTNPDPYLWRLLIDRMHQHRGIGHRVLDLLADQCRAWGDTDLYTSWQVGKGTPAPFYLSHGFVLTGEIVDGEIEARWNPAVVVAGGDRTPEPVGGVSVGLLPGLAPSVRSASVRCPQEPVV